MVRANFTFHNICLSDQGFFLLPVLRFVCPSPCSCVKYSIVEATELLLPSCLTLNVLDGIRAVVGGGAQYWKRHYSSYGFGVAKRLVPGKFQVAFPAQVGYFYDHFRRNFAVYRPGLA